MATYTIQVTDDAKMDLSFYTAFERKMIVVEIRTQLVYEPTTETRNRKKLNQHPIAAWELRVGKYRVFYQVDARSELVSVISIGHKEHNRLYIRNREVEI